MNSFIEKLRNETKLLHKMAERSGFNKSIFSGKANKESYCKYLNAKLQIYEAIEEAVKQNHSNEILSKCFIEGMERSAYIKSDIRKMGFENLLLEQKYSVVQSYLYHIQNLLEKSPALLSAHIYTLYLADMAGGGIIKQILKRQYQFNDDELNSYSFEKFPDLKEFISKYHQIIAQFVSEAHIENDFIEESKMSFILSTALLIELETD